MTTSTTSGGVPEPLFPATEQWGRDLEMWGVPTHIVDQAPESPAPESTWFHEIGRCSVEQPIDRDGQSHRWAREVLPPVGGTVLDVGCGGGRSTMPLVPPATEVVGVDTSGMMLDAFVAAMSAAGVARRTVHGEWPLVAPHTPVADVVVCHHVVFDVGDIAPFLLALTDHARLAVVMEVPVRHPMSAWAGAWRHFWNVERPAGPTLGGLLAVLREIGVDPEHQEFARDVSPFVVDEHSVAVARRRLCLSAERDAELADWLNRHPPPLVDRYATVRWPGDG
ncbi:MAG TPA: class I SAM-dependent methyltransferase [Ilumatobacter sp.]|nr:class I SAM-dependent methyltransferase [Ilumatobacter sp.]